MDSGHLRRAVSGMSRGCNMTSNLAIPIPDARNEEDARRNECMHRVYSYLLQLAARKEAADRDEAGNQARTAEDTQALKPSVEGV
jgi:hypothetical protein